MSLIHSWPLTEVWDYEAHGAKSLVRPPLQEHPTYSIHFDFTHWACPDFGKALEAVFNLRSLRAPHAGISSGADSTSYGFGRFS